jgi:hypothetical protein
MTYHGSGPSPPATLILHQTGNAGVRGGFSAAARPDEVTVEVVTGFEKL